MPNNSIVFLFYKWYHFKKKKNTIALACSAHFVLIQMFLSAQQPLICVVFIPNVKCSLNIMLVN